MSTNAINSKINVLFVIPSLRVGGAEMQTIDLLKNLDRNIFNVFLFTFSEDLSLLRNLDGIALTHFNHPRKYKFDLSMAPVLSRIIKDNDIKVIHCTLQIGLMIAWLGSVLSRKKPALINTLHRTIGRKHKEEILEYLAYQWPMRACKAVVCVCKNQEKFWLNRFPFLKSKVIYNGVDINKFDPAKFSESRITVRNKLGISDKAIVFACIAAFRIEKNHIGLLESFYAVYRKKNNSDIHLLLAGDGAEREKIRKFVSEKRLNDNVHLLGNLKDVRPILAASDVTVFASTSIETFSIAMLESMAMERPIITTNIGGHSEAVIDGKTGKLVNIGDIEELSAAITWCADNPSETKKMGLNARKKVSDSFTVNNMVRQTENLVLGVLR